MLYMTLEGAGHCDAGKHHPQLPESQEPLLHPPPPMGLVEVMPNPERGPASIYSTLIAPQVVRSPSSTKNLRSLFS